MKKSFKQWIGVGTTAVMAATVLAGCGSTTNTTQPSTAPSAGAAATANAKPFAGKTISLVTANHPWADAIKPLLPDFEKETGIKVNVESFFEDQLTQKLTVQFTSGSATPDVFMYRPLQEGKLFYKNGWVQPLDDYAQKAKDYDFNDFSKSAIGSTTVESKLAGIPIITEQEILYYRKDLLQKAGIAVPKTLDELNAAVKKLHDPKNEMYGFVARGQRSPLVTQVSSFLYSEGADFTTSEKASINTPEAIKAFTTYGTLLKDYAPPGVLNMSWPQAFGIFAQGKVAFLTDANSLYQNATDPAKSKVADQVGFAVFPGGKAGSKPYSITSWGLAMNAKSGNKDATWAFIQWATSKDVVLKTQQKGNPGARASVWDKPEGTTGFPAELVPIIKESAKTGVDHDRPTVISVGEARDAVGEIVQKVMSGETNLQPVADKANQALQTIIDKDKTR
ncbi:sugar ABC transporter substrate-binding protein [Paenibacillus chondroitinus]|uniref:Sugar ABC transporter substrate-binding protein n=1 Tax=Paenibacillus chondroitinus TaxID=59842 RepID=A0ABU6DMX6_9BACL|nr:MULTISPECIES: sugar ABC transporter substrate-binding protein [Paenibacillus]MCY9661449.1 sugar ABC transporter substrate-binding protein [Paenibacillus anseongense]MEB4799088.1 sugar ABC transporter substrate-binding protein [Paenibacillus chondroitinus]